MIVAPGQTGPFPSQTPSIAHVLAAGAHTVPAGKTTSAGQSSEVPLQTSSNGSHDPCEARQIVPEAL
jgi:hypothetical protein